MADTPTVTPETPTSIVNTPVTEPVNIEAKLFPTTPTGTEPLAVTPETPTPDATPAPEKPIPETKVPTDAKKPEVQTTPATPPTDYTLVLPENSLLSAEDLAAISKETKEAGLTKEKAQEVLQSRNNVATQTATRIKQQQDKAMSDAKVLWKSQVEKDPELGGANLAQTAILSSRGYAALVTPEDKQFIESLGLDHHPSFVRMMTKVGKLIGEDPRLILGQVGGAPVEQAREKILYGKTTPDETGKVSR